MLRLAHNAILVRDRVYLPHVPLTAGITNAGLRLRNSGNQAKPGYGSLRPP